MSDPSKEKDSLVESRLEQLVPSVCFNPCTSSPTAVGNAFDLLLIQSLTGQTTCSEALFSFGSVIPKTTKLVVCGADSLLSNVQTVLEVPRIHADPLAFPIVNQRIHMPQQQPRQFMMEERLFDEKKQQEEEEAQHDDEALQLLALQLRTGKNAARYLLVDQDDNTVLAMAPIDIYLWTDRDKVMVVDVDGTITKSNVRGVVDTVIMEDYKHCHDGVCEFLSSVFDNEIRLFYLTSRPIGLANSTRRFLSQLRQTEHGLPHGPLVGHMGSLPQVLFMELITSTIHEFKAETLDQTIVRPFLEHGVRDVFLAGFGNSMMDMQAYHMAGMDLKQIYLIDKKSNIFCLDHNRRKHHQQQQQRDSAYDNNRNNMYTANHPSKSTVPHPRNTYLHMRGTSFDGYLDVRLLDHVQSNKPSC